MVMGGSSGKDSRCLPATTRFVDVPIRVMVPPRMDANDSGMKRWPGARPAFLLQLVMMGISTKTTGELFMNAEITNTGRTIRTRAAA